MIFSVPKVSITLILGHLGHIDPDYQWTVVNSERVKNLKSLLVFSTVTPKIAKCLQKISDLVYNLLKSDPYNDNWINIIKLCHLFGLPSTVDKKFFQVQTLQSISAKYFKNFKLDTSDIIKIKKMSSKQKTEIHKQVLFENELMFI